MSEPQELTLFPTEHKRGRDLPERPCLSCGEDVVWVRNVLDDHLFPLDAAPGPAKDHHWHVERVDVDPAGGLRVPFVRRLRRQADRSACFDPLYISHVSTCTESRWVVAP